MKRIFTLCTFIFSIVLINSNLAADLTDTTNAGAIHLQKLTMRLAPGNTIFSEDLLAGEILDTDVSHVILAGPYSRSESLQKEHDIILVFIKGDGKLSAGGRDYIIKPECIAFAAPFENIRINAADGDTLHYLKIRKKLSHQDLEEIKSYPDVNRKNVYFTSFNECTAYTEKIKSPNTVSRTVLPKDIIPRVSMGTVETLGPDAVGAHRHPMLDQLFLGLAGSDITVHADDKSVHFSEFTLLHIPIGSNHWATVEKGKRMYYQWMDFFLTKEGEEWLKTHKPVDENKKR